MNDPHDELYAVRSYDCVKSRAARDRWLTTRESFGRPVIQHLDRFDAIPAAFQKQWNAMRDRK